jgi:hypothetical protein
MNFALTFASLSADPCTTDACGNGILSDEYRIENRAHPHVRPPVDQNDRPDGTCRSGSPRDLREIARTRALQIGIAIRCDFEKGS